MLAVYRSYNPTVDGHWRLGSIWIWLLGLIAIGLRTLQSIHHHFLARTMHLFHLFLHTHLPLTSVLLTGLSNITGFLMLINKHKILDLQLRLIQKGVFFHLYLSIFIG